VENNLQLFDVVMDWIEARTCKETLLMTFLTRNGIRMSLGDTTPVGANPSSSKQAVHKHLDLLLPVPLPVDHKSNEGILGPRLHAFHFHSPDRKVALEATVAAVASLYAPQVLGLNNSVHFTCNGFKINLNNPPQQHYSV
jgi:hypothetical protein